MKAMNERNPLGQAREAYESLRIPDELPDAVQDAVRQARGGSAAATTFSAMPCAPPPACA